MRIRTNRYQIVGLLVVLGMLIVPGNGTQADDTDLFTSRVAPNVVFIFDNSGSMNNVVWHPAFHPNAVYDPINCPYIADPDDPGYNELCLEHPLCTINVGDTILSGSGNQWAPFGGTEYQTEDGGTATLCNEREVYADPEVNADGNDTLWTVEYLRWYFSDNTNEDPDNDGNTIYDDIIATANGTRSQCLIDQGASATYDKYRRARVTAAKEITLEVICNTSLVADIRYGLAKFFTRTIFGFPLDPAGGWVNVPVDDYSTTHAASLAAAITAIEGETLTPLAETLYNVYRYLQERDDAKTALGKDGTTRFPKYNIRVSGSVDTSGIPDSPVLNECQKHFVVMITDGEATWDDFDDQSNDPLPPSQDVWRDDLIGDYRLPGDETEETNDSFERAYYLDDVAAFMQDKDFLPDAAYPGTQNVDVYTVGFTTNAAANDLLSRTALAGNGEFFYSNNAEELTEALTDTLTSIVAKSLSFTSAAVPASRTTDGNNFYSSFFRPIEDDPLWEGHLKDFNFTAAGEILTPAGNCAIGADPSATPPCASGGALRTTATAYWDAADEVPAPASRKLYVELGDKTVFTQPDEFLMPVNPADAVAAFGIVDNVDEFDSPYDTLSPNDPEDIAAALIDTLRGCQFGVSPCTPRTSLLGDMFHSNPVVVGSPNAAVNEGSYQTFANNYRDRTRVIYAGANDGFLHGFNAGIWRTLEQDGVTPIVPPRHDRGTGEELFGFMPYAVRNVAKDLLKDNSGLRSMVTVDGSPVVGDAWIYRDVDINGNLTSVNDTAGPSGKDPAQWRTVLMSGLRDGGQTYFALDITDPTASASDSSTSYPLYMWGFPCEDCANAENPGTAGETTYMGYSWSEPVITRVRVKADSATDPTTYERWVAIFGAGYHEHGDPNGPDYREPADAGFVPKGRAIYMVDLTTGEVLAKKQFDSAASPLSTTPTVGVKELRYAIPSSPAVFDLDFDGFADVVYIGDLGGNLWKWVIQSAGDDPINNSSYNASMAQPNWPFRLQFRSGTSLEPTLPPEQLGSPYDATVHYQSIFFPPTGVLRSGKLVLGFGAGERANPIGPAAEYGDNDLTNNNHYYVVKDSDPLEKTAPDPNPITDALDESDLADFDAPSPLTCAQMQATKEGYYITGRDAEKFITNSVVFLGTVFTGSFLPNDPNNATTCGGAGTSYLYAFDLECGVGKYPTNPGGDDDKRRKSIGAGIPTRPRVSVGGVNSGGGGGGCESKVVVVTSDGNIENDCPGPIPGSGVNVKSWRER